MALACAAVASSCAPPAQTAQTAQAQQTPSQGAPLPTAMVARTVDVPACTVFVDASAAGDGAGTVQQPYKTITAAVAAATNGAVICVAQGAYDEQIKPGEKYFTLAGGFQPGQGFKVRDSAKFVSRATGRGGSFIRYEDPAPKDGQLTAIDGFEITGYSQAIYREFYESQRFDITNNYIHDNTCADPSLAGAGFALNNVSGTISGNVISNNSCGRGGAGFLSDSTNKNTVSIEGNLVDGNSGTEPDTAHGGGLYLFGNTLRITGNLITNNRVTQWGGGLYVGAFPAGGQPTTATMAWNVYRGNRAGNSGGGFFCDDGATCVSTHEIYDRNCGGNVLLDSGTGPTTSRLDQFTNVGALAPQCDGPGDGVRIDSADQGLADAHTISNAIFWGNGRDFAVGCSAGCTKLKVNVSRTMARTAQPDGFAITFGEGMIAPVDPLFVSPAAGDFHLQAASPAKGKGAGGGDLGAYGGPAAAKAP